MRETEIKKAVEVLNRGGIVIFPTDTAFGIGCRIDNRRAVERLFKIRRRPQDKAVPVLVDSIDMARKYWSEIPKEVEEKLLGKFWPGALTVILRCNTSAVPALVRGGGKTLGLRMPKHTAALYLVEKTGAGILAPSANFSGSPTPYRFEDLDKDLVKLVDYILPGKTGGHDKASTVVDCSTRPWRILREGAVRLGI